MKRVAILVYGVTCYALFLATLLYAIGFVGNLIVPKSIDSVPAVSFGTALFINSMLLVAWASQQSAMDRHYLSRAWTRFSPGPTRRGIGKLRSSLALILLFVLWEPIDGLIWDVQDQFAETAIYVAYGLGWTLVLASAFSINYLALPTLSVGWVVVTWATPTMTVGHLFFALAVTLYTVARAIGQDTDRVTCVTVASTKTKKESS